jgi:hypothetical protein
MKHEMHEIYGTQRVEVGTLKLMPSFADHSSFQQKQVIAYRVAVPQRFPLVFLLRVRYMRMHST